MSRFVFAFCPAVIAIAVLVFVVDPTNFAAANKNCKNTVMNVVMKQCSGSGIRARREVNEENIEPEEKGSESQHEKRQVSPQSVAALIPLVSEVLTGGSRGMGYDGYNPYMSNPDRYYGNGPFMQGMGYHPNYYPMPYGPGFATDPRFSAINGFMPPAAGDDLLGMGIDLSTEDIEELYDEVSQRLPRAAKNKEEAKKMFLAMAARCCHDPELCLTNEKLISCV